ncbi:MAG: ATP-binding domain-containing protein [Alcanivoracaceae bacterium]|nr:ATP-binding domain-containing protein [Alcanivoracaceae bacterium]
MAHIIPSDWLEADFLHEREKETVGWLEEALPDEFTVYAGLRWAATHVSGHAQFGEVDLAVVAPSGKLIIIEQKNGGLSVVNGRLVKRYGTHEKAVGIQIRRSVEAFQKQWAEQGHGGPLWVDYLVVLPDYRVHDVNAVELQAERIVDRERLAQLPDLLQELLDGRPNPERQQALRDFLDGTLGISQDLDIASLRMDQRLAARGDSLRGVISRLEFKPWRMRISGAAGCGKTVLAQGLFRDARREGKRVIYLCYNRPLADGVARALKAPGQAMTIDRLTELYPVDGPFDPSEGQMAFESRRALIRSNSPHEDWQFDLVVVDEGQDFSGSQCTLAEHLLAADGRFVWLDDPRQKLYRHEDSCVPDCTVSLTLAENFRTANNIVRYMNAMLALEPPDIPSAPVDGEVPDFRVADTHDAVHDAVVARVGELLEAGYRLDDIAVLSYHGYTSSWLLQREHIGVWPTIRFTGAYTENGEQRYSEGQLRVESIHRFKGLQAEAVILVEVDFEELNDEARRRLYVGMTRARQSLTVIMNDKADQALRVALA